MNKRIDYIDLAKGFCILLVVLSHTFGPFNKTYANIMLGCFRMPLYFFLSGLFFKKYGGFFNFTLRKTNKLVVPFVFFTVTTYLLYAVGWTVLGHFDKIKMFFHEIVINIQSEFVYLNPPLWFLITLFETSLLFYLVFFIRSKLTIKENGKKVIMAVMCFSIGILGYALGSYHINLPLWLDSSMTVLPFYYLGYFFREETDILITKRLDKYIPALLVFCGLIVYFLAEKIEIVTNTYSGNIFSFYVSAISGTLFVMLLSKLITKIPVISYLGRYSIIVLGTHWVLLYISGYFLSFISNGWLLSGALFILVVFIEIPVVKFLLRYFPKFVSQEDLIKVDNFQSGLKESI